MHARGSEKKQRAALVIGEEESGIGMWQFIVLFNGFQFGPGRTSGLLFLTFGRLYWGVAKYS